MEIGNLKKINHATKMKHYCYLLIKPDTIIRRLTHDILHYFEEIGMLLLDYRIGHVSDEQYQAMYADSFKWSLDYWQHNQKIYSFGPGIGMAFWLWDYPQKFRNAQEYLYSLKGNAIPEYQDANCLRYRFDASDRVFNLLHVPDDLEQAIREARLWFGNSVLRKQVCNSNPTTGYYALVTKEINRHGYLANNLLNGWVTYTYIKIRILHSIKKSYTMNASIEKKICFLESCYDSSLTEINNHLTGRQHSKYIQNMVITENELYTELIKDLRSKEASKMCPSPEIVINLIININNRTKPTMNLLEYFWNLLLRWRVYTTDLERYIVTSTFLYPVEHDQ